MPRPRSHKKPIKPGDGDPRHGTANGYDNLGCRCRACKDAWAKYRREGTWLADWRDRQLEGLTECVVDGCSFKPDRSYPKHGYCHRHNVEFGIKAAK